MRRILFDTNVILDVALAREPFHESSLAVWNAAQMGLVNGCVTSSSLTDICYIVEKNSSAVQARMIMHDILRDLELVHVSRESALLALNPEYPDIEDAMQYHAAVANNCDAIVTRNVKDFPEGGLPVITPDEFIKG